MDMLGIVNTSLTIVLFFVVGYLVVAGWFNPVIIVVTQDKMFLSIEKMRQYDFEQKYGKISEIKEGIQNGGRIIIEEGNQSFIQTNQGKQAFT